MRLRPVTLAAVAAILFACSSPTPSTSESAGASASELRVPTIPLARESLLAADAATANDASLRGVDGLLAHFADDASLLLRRTNLLTGKAAIKDYFAQNPLPGFLGWRYVRGDVSALGDVGYTLGWLEVIGPQDDQGQAPVAWSIYMATWERREAWRITALVKIDLVGPPAAAPAGMLPLTNDGPVYPSFGGAANTAKKLVDLDTAFAAYTQTVGVQKGFDAYVAEDGIEISDPLTFGRAAIFAANAGAAPGSSLDWAPVAGAGRASQSGDLGFTIGTYVSTFTNPDGTKGSRYGKYLTVWKRQADGSFKWVLDGGNSSPAP